MKTHISRPPGFINRVTIAFTIVLTTLFVHGTAFANTAANTVIHNTATVTYDDVVATGYSTTSSVDITVNLVQATASLSVSIDQTVTSGSTFDYTYTISTNANGPDTYNLSVADDTPKVGVTSNTLDIRSASGGGGSTIASIALAATTVATDVGPINAGASQLIEVPNDGITDAAINGFVGGETIIVDKGGNNWAFTVASIGTDATTGKSQMTITNNTAGSVSLTAGMLIAQQRNFYLRETPVATTQGITIANTLTAADSVPNSTNVVSTTTVNVGANITVVKYVRNVLNAAGNAAGAGAQTINGVTYYTSGVKGNPGDTLEYVIRVQNAVNAGAASNVIISDPIPTFTTSVANSMLLDNDTAADASTVAGWSTTPTDTEADADTGEFDPTVNAQKVWIYAGSGGADTGTAATYGDGTGGSLAGGATGAYTFGAFRVTIN